MMMFIEIIKCFIVGLVFGSIFFFLKLPIPAPNYFPAVFGIVGTTVAYLLLQRYIGH